MVLQVQNLRCVLEGATSLNVANITIDSSSESHVINPPLGVKGFAGSQAFLRFPKFRRSIKLDSVSFYGNVSQNVVVSFYALEYAKEGSVHETSMLRLLIRLYDF